MKKNLKHLNCIILLLMMLLLPNTMLSIEANNSQTVILQKKPVKKEHNQELDREGTRMPSRPITCVIDSEGIHIPGVDESDISICEVYDINGNCIAAFTDPSDFIAFIFSCQDEEIEIRIHTDEQILYGFLTL